jgi:aminopeptidase
MTTYDPQLLEKYAKLAVKAGLNLQPDQRLLISGAPTEVTPLVRLLSKHAYLAGARYVEVIWADQELERLRLEYGPPEALDEFPEWRVQVDLEYFEAADAHLRFYANNPDLMAGQDPAALKKINRIKAEKTAPVAKHISQFSTNWLIISGSTSDWAAKVFPGLTAAAAEAKLWDAIFEICRVKEEDPVVSWQKHVAHLAARREYLTAKAYEKLHYQGPGTDLTIGLPAGHFWFGGNETAQNGIRFMPNIPTEEVATIPHRERINGTVSSTKPLSWNGVIIENFSLTFANGRVIQATAEKGEAALEALLETDEGALSLGEVALVPHSSSISQSGILFYNTLYDENASCHLALGRAYKAFIRGGAEMSEEDFLNAGGNISLIHVDFMVGSDELDVDGYLPDGTIEPILLQGEWAFDV